MEIERKWMVKGWPEFLGEPLKTQKMRQGYIYMKPRAITLRIREEETVGGATQYILCFKLSMGTGLARQEIENELTREEFEECERQIGLPLIPKERRSYRLADGGVLEVNHVDEGQPTEFWYAEIEYDTENSAEEWKASDLSGELAEYLDDEVTYRAGFSMGAYWARTRLGIG